MEEILNILRKEIPNIKESKGKRVGRPKGSKNNKQDKKEHLEF